MASPTRRMKLGVFLKLQERVLFRRGYEGSALRENLGLPVPVSRYSDTALARAAS